MAQIVELRELTDEKLEEKLENVREEMFNLRFQLASAQLEDRSRVRAVRREIAQIETVLHNRWLAAETAAQDADIVSILSGREWKAKSRFDSDSGGWRVSFVDDNDVELISAMVNLNQAKLQGRKARRTKAARSRVTSYSVAG